MGVGTAPYCMVQYPVYEMDGAVKENGKLNRLCCTVYQELVGESYQFNAF